jgi:hypothetical protein
MSPDLNNLSAGHGRLLSGQHDEGDNDGHQYGRDYAGPDHVTGAPGEFFTAGGIVHILRVFLME